MKKLFRFMILTAMALALVLPFSKPQEVKASDDGTETDIKVGQTVQLTGKILDDENFYSFGGNYNLDFKHFTVKSDDNSIAEAKIVNIQKKPVDPHATDYMSRSGPTIVFTVAVTGKAEGMTYISIYDGTGKVELEMVASVNVIKANGQSSRVKMWRLYNPYSGEHFYTKNDAEKANLVRIGWRDEGVGWFAPADGDPVYRLYNKYGGEHHYTLNKAEKNNLVSKGWRDEGIGWYSDKKKTVPIYRVYNPNAFANNHHYTIDKGERDNLKRLGWKDEGIGWYGVR